MLRKFVLYHLPALAYAALIIGLSSLSDIRLPHVQFIEIDKVAHFCEYLIFGWLVFRAARHLSARIQTDDAAFLSVGFVTLFAFGDEFYQSFIPGRQSDAWDFIIDVVAVTVAVVAVRLVARRSQEITA